MAPGWGWRSAQGRSPVGRQLPPSQYQARIGGYGHPAGTHRRWGREGLSGGLPHGNECTRSGACIRKPQSTSTSPRAAWVAAQRGSWTTRPLRAPRYSAIADDLGRPQDLSGAGQPGAHAIASRSARSPATDLGQGVEVKEDCGGRAAAGDEEERLAPLTASISARLTAPSATSTGSGSRVVIARLADFRALPPLRDLPRALRLARCPPSTGHRPPPSHRLIGHPPRSGTAHHRG